MNEPIVILGFGVTGQSVARFLLRDGVTPFVLDTRSARKVAHEFSLLEIQWSCSDWPDSLLKRSETVVVSPGLSMNNCLIEQAKTAGLELISDIDLFFRYVDKPVIGITGTNGKSTVVSLLGHMFNRAGYNCLIGGNLGKAALDLLNDSADLYVLELSSFQLERTQSLPLTSAAILNISEDHVDHHGSLEQYLEAKQKIFAATKSCIHWREDSNTAPPNSVSGSSFGFGQPLAKSDWGLAYDKGEEWVFCGDIAVCAVETLPTQGRHNALNCLAAMAVAAAWITPEQMVRCISGFKALDHRFQRVAESFAITFINDSKATNVGSTKAALDGLSRDNNIILIAGGDAKGANLGALADSLVGRVKYLLGLGSDAPAIEALAATCKIPYTFAFSMQDAVTDAVKLACPGDMVLLSPACSSLDMYENFQQRGDIFAACVNALMPSDFKAVGQ
jgi:UDP-N-acetylmuramoylalanine--D-glutamate ligase